MSYPVIRQETIYKGKVFDVRRDDVTAPDGHVMHLDIVEHSGAVAFVPIDEDGNIWLVRQYRHPAGQHLLEIPAGTLEAGEDAETCVVRECREEIGMAPGSIQRLGGVFLAPGYSTEYLHFYRVSDLKPAPLTPDDDEDLQVVKMSPMDMRAGILDGRIIDGKTVAALTLLELVD